jgi:hypothetical protein
MWNRLLCCLTIVVATFGASEARAWHGHHGRIHHGYGWGGYGGFYGGFAGYGLGGYGLGYSSSFVSFSSWPYASYYSSYRYAPLSIGYRPAFYGGCWPRLGYSYSAFYTPTYYVPTYSVPIYSYPAYMYPTCYSSVSGVSGGAYVANYNIHSTGSASLARLNAMRSANATYIGLKPPVSTKATPLVLQSAANNQPVPRYIAASTSSVQSVDRSDEIKFDAIPEDLLASADAILAAGGYREAAQAYAQLTVHFGSSDRLALRRFVAQVAGGDYEQAAVMMELALVGNSNLRRLPLPFSTLEATVGASAAFIAERTEGLAANALQQPKDAAPMAAVALWLTLAGDHERADLFTRRVEQLQGSALISTSLELDRVAALPVIH